MNARRGAALAENKQLPDSKIDGISVIAWTETADGALDAVGPGRQVISSRRILV
jgi:hypothetical protein